MRTAAAHYDSHLGPVYAWTLGDIDAATARSAVELDEMQLPAASGTAVDLGAGLGLHAIPLARRGFRVVAIDGCEMLLEQLRSRGAALPIACVKADFLDFRSFIGEPPQAILCMGDTLTHLKSLSDIETLFASVSVALKTGGMFATTFRDYATSTLEGEQRFIPVRADDDRVLTCFIEYQEHVVTVHDVLNQRENGLWRQSVSSYPKLRLAPEWVEFKLKEQGLTVQRHASLRGMTRITAIKA